MAKKHPLFRTSILLITILVLSLTLSSCKKQEPVSEGNHTAEPPALETSTYEDGFISERPQDEQWDSSEITITLDNWNQYFEVRESPVWEEDAFGEAETFRARYCLFLKDEYRGRIDETKESSVAFAFEYDWILADIEVDYNTREFSYTGKVHEYSQGKERTTFVVDTWMLMGEEDCGTICSCAEGYFTDDNDVKIPNCYQFTNVEVTKVEGSLFLFDGN